MAENIAEPDYALLVSELKNICADAESVNESEIERTFKRRQYDKGEFFVKEGDVPNKLGFITRGLMKYYYIDRDGNEWIKHFSIERDFVASYAGFLYRTPSLYYIEAMEDTAVLSIDLNTYIDNVNSSMLWCTIARKYTEKIYYEKEKREAEFLRYAAAARYFNFKNEYRHLLCRISLQDTASFLGMTPVSLSRIRNNKQH